MYEMYVLKCVYLSKNFFLNIGKVTIKNIKNECLSMCSRY